MSKSIVISILVFGLVSVVLGSSSVDFQIFNLKNVLCKYFYAIFQPDIDWSDFAEKCSQKNYEDLSYQDKLLINSPTTFKIKHILSGDNLIFFGERNGLYTSNLRTAINRLKILIGDRPNGNLDPEILGMIFPDCEISFTNPIPGETIYLDQPYLIRWQYSCSYPSAILTSTPIVRSLNQGFIPLQIGRLLRVNIYLIQECNNTNRWFLDENCKFWYLGSAPLDNQMFFWIPKNLSTGNYSLRLTLNSYQIFYRDLLNIPLFIPTSDARLFADSGTIKIQELTSD